MAYPANSIVKDGIARSPDGAMYVTASGSGGNVEYSVAQWGVPFILCSSGSIGNNGALTGITALPQTYADGAWVYYPANAISASSAAGFYWTVFSSTTAGTIYNSTYTSGVPGLGTTTAFATTGPGAFTGDTAADRVGPSITIPALGASSTIRYQVSASSTSGAGAKTYKAKYSGSGGTTIWSGAPSTGGVGNIGYIRNRGLTNRQVASNIQAIVADTIVTAYMSVDTTAATSLVFTLQKATAAENAVLEQGGVWVTNQS